MPLPESFLHPGRQVRIRADGAELSGTVQSVRGGWLRLALAEGEALVCLANIAWVAAAERSAYEPDDDLPVAREKDVQPRGTGRIPGRPWADADVKRVIDQFLEGKADAEVAEAERRTRHQVTVLRQAWESGRGNIPEDRISPAAQAWVERLRKILAG